MYNARRCSYLHSHVVPCTAGAASLPEGKAPRPGPKLLYLERPPVAPQLTNRKPWRAKPILVSGTTSYRRGEFVYQDFLYDDSGALLTLDPNDPRTVGNLFSKQNGTYTYPTDEAYANNAADLVELRVRPLRRATAFRVTLNTLKDPSLVAFSVALGGAEGEPHEFPFGANVSAPAEYFLTVHPDGDRMVADLTTADGDEKTSFAARVDLRRRQIEVQGAAQRMGPGQGVGAPGGGRRAVGRRGEQLPAAGLVRERATRRAARAGRRTRPRSSTSRSAPTSRSRLPTENEEAIVNAAWWRDRAQGNALAAGDISEFFATVDFDKLARRVRDDSAVPKTGAMDRIYSSRFELSQGADFSVSCFPGDAATCPGQYQGRLQPYAIYIPEKPMPRRGYGLTLLLHSLSANYNQYLGTRNQSQFGERGRGLDRDHARRRAGPTSSTRTTAPRTSSTCGPTSPAAGSSIPRWTVTTGYSMGGIGSFKLGAQFPDLFARDPADGRRRGHDRRARVAAQRARADVEHAWRRARQQPRFPGDRRRARRSWATATSSTRSSRARTRAAARCSRTT